MRRTVFGNPSNTPILHEPLTLPHGSYLGDNYVCCRRAGLIGTRLDDVVGCVGGLQLRGQLIHAFGLGAVGGCCCIGVVSFC